MNITDKAWRSVCCAVRCTALTSCAWCAGQPDATAARDAVCNVNSRVRLCVLLSRGRYAGRSERVRRQAVGRHPTAHLRDADGVSVARSSVWTSSEPLCRLYAMSGSDLPHAAARNSDLRSLILT
eukprot:1734093-Rhodomonas_salina.3